MVVYTQAQDGSLILLLSDLAQHTINIKKIATVSLMISAGQQVQTADMPRVSLQATLMPVESNSDYVQRYYSYYPEAQQYVTKLDFRFYRASVSQIYLVAGFGDVAKYSADLIKGSPFTFEDEQHMIEHMNSDHSDAIQHYCDKVSIHYKANEQPILVGITAHGFHIKVDNKLYWFSFETPCENVNSVRQALVKMAQC